MNNTWMAIGYTAFSAVVGLHAYHYERQLLKEAEQSGIARGMRMDNSFNTSTCVFKFIQYAVSWPIFAAIGHGLPGRNMCYPKKRDDVHHTPCDI